MHQSSQATVESDSEDVKITMSFHKMALVHVSIKFFQSITHLTNQMDVNDDNSASTNQSKVVNPPSGTASASTATSSNSTKDRVQSLCFHKLKEAPSSAPNVCFFCLQDSKHSYITCDRNLVNEARCFISLIAKFPEC